MHIKIVTLSPKGQITIPKIFRKMLSGRKFLLEFRDGILLLKPCRISIKKKNSFVSEAFIETILEMPDDQRRIYHLIRENPCSTDFLIEKTSFDVSTVNVLLTELEFKGVLRRNANHLWELSKS